MTGDARAGAFVEYVVELVGFPGTKYDDQVDSTIQALDHMREDDVLSTYLKAFASRFREDYPLKRELCHALSSHEEVLDAIERVTIGAKKIDIRLSDAVLGCQDRTLTIPWRRPSSYQRREIVQGEAEPRSAAKRRCERAHQARERPMAWSSHLFACARTMLMSSDDGGVDRRCPDRPPTP
jgi:hypothetical protein